MRATKTMVLLFANTPPPAKRSGLRPAVMMASACADKIQSSTKRERVSEESWQCQKRAFRLLCVLGVSLRSLRSLRLIAPATQSTQRYAEIAERASSDFQDESGKSCYLVIPVPMDQTQLARRLGLFDATMIVMG